MEAVIFTGIQGSGKSSFYKERFFLTHVRLNLDMLRTRHREAVLLRACIDAKQPFVVDNTNPAAADRQRYIAPARAGGFRVVGYYFEATVDDALRRNAARPPAQQIPKRGVLGTRKRLQPPRRDEGFDELFVVHLDDGGGFRVEVAPDEV
jgi:predicted kinase